MPFKPTPAPLPVSPVCVQFAGQLLISSERVSPCEIAVNHFAPLHELSLNLIVCKPGRPPTIQPLCLNRLEGDFTISVDPPYDVGGVTAYEPTPEPFRRDDPNNDPQDLRWAIDMGKMHAPDRLATNDAGVRPCVTLSDGVLYSIDIINREKMSVELACGSTTTDLVSMAESIGAVIPLEEKRQVVLAWDEPAGRQMVRLPRENDPAGTTYVVTVVNDPPYGTPPDDELGHYYNVLQRADGSTIPTDQRCQLIVSKKGTGIEKTDEIPCMPVLAP
ncbi:MAG: hypothetical protein ACJ741_07325 [Pyrinomonadaceae bacterium]